MNSKPELSSRAHGIERFSWGNQVLALQGTVELIDEWFRDAGHLLDET